MRRSSIFRLSLVAALSVVAVRSFTQGIATPWSGYGHDPQHTAISSVAAQPLNRIKWQMPMDLNPQYSGSNLYIHYGSPLITASNTVIAPVKTNATGGFRLEARNGASGAFRWQLNTDYILPPHSWVPSCGPTLNFRNRVYVPAAGGTVLYRDNADSAAGNTGRIAFFGNANYTNNQAACDSRIFINTPITVDRYGTIYFGYQVTGSGPIAPGLTLQSGLARITLNGVGSFVEASSLGDPSVTKISHNCAPALSNDQRTLYVAASNGNGTGFPHGSLIALDARTLAPITSVRLKDPKSGLDAYLPEDGTASPTVGPDGDVYFGVLENPFPASHDRGWLLHFDGGLAPKGANGGFGWDDTASIVPASMVPSYTGTSTYLVMTKYNNYAGVGGNGINQLAVLDPNATQIDPITGTLIMKEVLTVNGVTPDTEFPNSPGAVREWCINTAAVDPKTKSIIVNSEDGKCYRWDLVSNTLTQPITLTGGVGEAYTSTVIGVDGTCYAINNATLFALGN
jgi:hypothetical protein